MKRCLVALAVLLASSASAEEPEVSTRPARVVFATAGIGLPTILHAEVGAFVKPWLTVEARWANVLFNTEVGVGSTVSLLGLDDDRPRRHSLLLAGEVMLNPFAPDVLAPASGDTLTWFTGAYVGYAFLADVGFYARAFVGSLIYPERSSGEAVRVAFGPNATVALGWAF